jgi:hypothetical protein
MGIILSKKLWLLTFSECGHHPPTYSSLDRIFKAGSIFEGNFWSISEISECLGVTEIKSVSWRILLWKK